MKTFQLLVLVIAVLVLNGRAWATTVFRMDLETLIRESDSIVQGEVERVAAEWDEQKRTIFTYVLLRVHDQLKGNLSSTMLIRQLGGKVGSMRLSIVGMPAFSKGEEVIVFLKRTPEQTYQVVGLGQGKYDITNDFAIADISGIDLVDKRTGQVMEGDFLSRQPLANFKAQIRRLVK